MSPQGSLSGLGRAMRRQHHAYLAAGKQESLPTYPTVKGNAAMLGIPGSRNQTWKRSRGAANHKLLLDKAVFARLHLCRNLFHLSQSLSKRSEAPSRAVTAFRSWHGMDKKRRCWCFVSSLLVVSGHEPLLLEIGFNAGHSVCLMMKLGCKLAGPRSPGHASKVAELLCLNDSTQLCHKSINPMRTRIGSYLWQ